MNCFFIVVSEYKLYTFESIISTIYGSEHLPLDSRLETGRLCDKYDSLRKTVTSSSPSYFQGVGCWRALIMLHVVHTYKGLKFIIFFVPNTMVL
jgi:hypothetical protein